MNRKDNDNCKNFLSHLEKQAIEKRSINYP